MGIIPPNSLQHMEKNYVDIYWWIVSEHIRIK